MDRDLKPVLVEAAQAAPPLSEDRTPLAAPEGASRMFMTLRCSNCGDAAEVAFAQLYDLWKTGYDKLCDEHKKKARVNTEIKCHCGTTDTHDGPMFLYLFQLIFDEVVRTSKA